ncbi:MAG: hypothetical protein DRN12_02575 [Thermoplasmata archaeon]|nr:MAG: hypothetical protein DRN12_02575 [Thermoplasmata archaeon]
MVADTIKFAESKVNLPYDSDSQFGLRKQVKDSPDLNGKDKWWYGALPPRGGSGNTGTWIYWFSHPVSWAKKYYCTELVWAAYFQGSQGNRYLENTPDLGPVRGWEIEHAEYGQVQLISGTPSGSPLQHDND